MRESTINQRLDRLERTVRRQRLMLGAVGLGGAAALSMALAPAAPGTIEAQAIRIVDASGKPRILIGAPPPADGRQRKDAGTASIVVLGPDGADRLVLGEEPPVLVDGKTYPRIADAYGLLIHDAKGNERGGFSFLDNGRAILSLDRPGGDAVLLTANDKTGFAGLVVNYQNPLGKYAEGLRMGTQADTVWLSLQDRAEGERARLAVDGRAAPKLITRAAGAPPAP
ncbi:hypothetical protein [Sphingomonas sp.]|uniref:hypothetical protein n=1 Tax=Sphingomonas sp. TaxID=28214 RepID=UPI0025D10499|nr:hypothetical protein [Sphingomonas sp.]